ncbi:MAG TPA: 30S ribosomal protein S2 [Bacilli bacterium]|nr:30S ribosomal protein S2 [Bacilli bacterium]
MSEKKLHEKVETHAQEEVQETSHTMDQVLPDIDRPVITMKKLLEAGAHFGHQTKLWNPKMRPYIFGSRHNVHIIDLEKSLVKIEEAYAALREIVTKNGKVLFVGTRKPHCDFVKAEALRSGSFYINSRWLGGTLTNFKTISSRVKYLRDLEMQEADGTLDRLSKKEAALVRKEIDRLTENFEGIKEMRRIPEAIFLVNPLEDKIALREARLLNIPVFALVDTNADPDDVDYIIPANDDATKSVSLLLQLFADAIVEAKGGVPIVAYSLDIEQETDTLASPEEKTKDEVTPEPARRARKVRTEHSAKPKVEKEVSETKEEDK